MSLIVAGYPGEVSEVEFARMLRFFAYHAVEGTVLTPSGSSRGVEVKFDEAFAPGVYVKQSAPMIVNAPENLSGFTRRDRIILKHDWSAGETTLDIKAGTPSSNPSLPSVVLEPGTLFEQTLGSLTTQSGQGAYPAANITTHGFPRQSPVLVHPFDGATPVTAERVIRIDPDSGLLRYSDGSSTNRPLRTRYQDLDRRILRKSGSTAGTLGVGKVGFYSSNNVLQFDIRQPGDPTWTGGGIHSAQFRVPVSGLYFIAVRARVSRTNSNQTGRVSLQFRSNMTPQVANSGSGAILNTYPFPVATGAPFTLTGTYLVSLTAGTFAGITIENFSSHSVDLDDNGTGTNFSVEYRGPSS